MGGAWSSGGGDSAHGIFRQGGSNIADTEIGNNRGSPTELYIY